MRKKKNSEPFNVRNITFRVNTDPENNTPEKIQQRMRNLIEIAIDIAGRQGLLRSGLTAEQARETWRKMDLKEKRARTSAHLDKAEDFDLSEPEQKEIRIQLHHNQWCQIRVEARKMHISHTELAKRWILEGLSKRS